MNADRCRITVGVVVKSLLLVTVHHATAGMRFASDRKSTANCQIEACYDILSRNVTGFLLEAPCPPPSNFSLICKLCESGTTSFLTCDEKTAIIKKCLHVYPQVLKCDIVEQCKHLDCLSFKNLVNDCDSVVENDTKEPTDDKVIVRVNISATQTEFTLAHKHSKMDQATVSTMTYTEDGDYVKETDNFPQPMREENTSLVGLAALLLLLIPLIFIIWFCCKRRKTQKENKYPKQEDASSTAGLCKTVSSVNECSPTTQSGDFENLDLPYIDSDELETVHTECPPHVENTVT